MIDTDTETCGLVGPAVTIQWYDGVTAKIHHIWKNSAAITLSLIEWLTEQEICAFNLSYDWFHLQKIYNILKMCDPDTIPDPQFCAVIEKEALALNICIKPQAALDLMMIARKGKYQSLMERKPILIKKVPVQTIPYLIPELEKRLKITPIHFARVPRDHEMWDILDTNDPGFKNLRLRFFASGSLKAILRDLGIKRQVERFTLVQPVEQVWKPYGGAWINHIKEHIDYWYYDKEAQIYAKEDVINLAQLREALGNPPAGDIDSELTICIACCRHRGYALDLDVIDEEQVKREFALAPTAPRAAKAFIERETIVNIGDTRKVTLEKLDGAEIKNAGLVLRARRAQKKLDLFQKLRSVGRFHPDFKTIGTRSGRMSGGGFREGRGRETSINPQGIQKSPEIRRIFTLRDSTLPILCGGDFAAFEISIQDAIWNDPQLRKDLKSGIKIYNIFGNMLEEVGARNNIAYHDLKTALLGWTYGAHEEKLGEVLKIDYEFAKAGIEKLIKTYPKIKEARDKVAEKFCSMSQPGGLGTQVVWSEPAEYMETLFGFKRFFHLENYTCKVLYALACNLPSEITTNANMVERNRNRGMQTVGGATRSALYAAAFSIQSANMRQANNHIVQGTGAHITKVLQSRLWELQPKGISNWRVAPFNIHDEIQCPVKDKEMAKETIRISEEIVEEFKPIIPLIKLDWKTNLNNWGDK